MRARVGGVVHPNRMRVGVVFFYLLLLCLYTTYIDTPSQLVTHFTAGLSLIEINIRHKFSLSQRPTLNSIHIKVKTSEAEKPLKTLN